MNEISRFVVLIILQVTSEGSSYEVTPHRKYFEERANGYQKSKFDLTSVNFESVLDTNITLPIIEFNINNRRLIASNDDTGDRGIVDYEYDNDNLSDEYDEAPSERPVTLEQKIETKNLFVEFTAELTTSEKAILLSLIRDRNPVSSLVMNKVEYIRNSYPTPEVVSEHLLLILAAKNNTFAAEVILQDVDNAYVSDGMGNTPLHYTALNGNAPLALAITQRDAGGINKKNFQGETALLIAALKNDSDVCRILLNKADPYIPDENGETSLHFTILNKNQEILQIILSKSNAGINNKNNYSNTALSLAVGQSNSVLIAMLLKAGADPYISNAISLTCLHLAVMNENREIVQLILSVDKTGIDKKNNEGDTALSMAIRKNNTLITEILVNNSVNPFSANNYKQTPLHLAVNMINIDIIKIILQKNVNGIDMKDESQNTALAWATFYGHSEIVRLLLTYGADSNAAGRLEATPLHVACIIGSLEILKIILNGTNTMPNPQDQEGNTPLHYSVATKQIDFVETLLKNGANPIIVNNQKRTALHIAALLEDLDISEELIKASASVIDIQDIYGYTALHLACLHGRKGAAEIVRTSTEGESDITNMWIQYFKNLLIFGADPYIRDQNGCTTLHTASTIGNIEIVSAILNHSKNGINIRDFGGSTALHLAIHCGKMEIAEFLLKNEADPYIQDIREMTSLHLSVIYGNLTIIKEIIAKTTAGINIIDVAGATALLYAVLFPLTVNNWMKKPSNGRDPFNADEKIQKFVPVGVTINNSHYGSQNQTRMSKIRLREIGSLVVPYIQINKIIYALDSTIADDIIPDDINEYLLQHRIIRYSNISPADLTLGSSVEPYLSLSNQTSVQSNNPPDVTSFSSIRTQMVEILINNGADLSITDKNGQTIYHAAVQSGSTELIDYFLKEKNQRDLNAKNNKGETALHLAIQTGVFNISKLLLINMVDPYSSDNYGRTALHVAAENHDLKIVELILNISNTGINLRDYSGQTVLLLGIRRGNKMKDICDILLKNGADPYISDEGGHTSLHAAVVENVQRTLFKLELDLPADFSSESSLQSSSPIFYNGEPHFSATEIPSVSVVGTILKYNSLGVNLRNKLGYSALFLAALYSNFEDVKILLHGGADPYITDIKGRTSLHAAVLSQAPSMDIVNEILTTSNIGVNMQDSNGYTALHYAVMSSPRVVNVLLKNGADPNLSENRYGWTPLHLAVYVGNEELVEVLLANSKTDINIQNEFGQTALRLTLNENVVRLLVKKGGKVNYKDLLGWNYLHTLAYYGSTNLINIILSSNQTNVNVRTSLGDTVLHIAVAMNNLALVEHLLQMGADPNVLNYYLRSPLFTASDKDIDLFDLIIQKGGKPFVEDIFGFNAFQRASLLGELEKIELILRKFQGSVDVRNSFGRSALLTAASGGQSKVLEKLIKYEANPFLTDNFGQNLFHFLWNVETTGNMYSIIHRRARNTGEDLRKFVNQRDFMGNSPLENAALTAKRNEFEFLWNRGAYTNTPGESINLLVAAALGGDTEIIKYVLVNTNAPVNEKAFNGLTPAMAAALRGRRTAFDLLISKNARIDDISYDGQTMLHFGAQGGDTNIIQKIINNSNVDVNSKDLEGYTPLMCAVYCDNLSAVDLLLNYSADPLMMNTFGEDAIAIAAKGGNNVLKSKLFNTSFNPDSVLGILLARRTSLNEKQILFNLLDQSSFQKYPIYLAAARGDLKALKITLSSPIKIKNHSFPYFMKEIMKDYNNLITDLLENKNRTPKDHVHLSPVHIALLFNQNLTVVKLLIEKIETNISSTNFCKNVWTILDFAFFAHSKYMNDISKNVMLYMLIKHKHVLNISSNIHGWGVAHKAAWTRNSVAITSLQYYGIDFDAVDKFGRTPLHYAALMGAFDVATRILHISDKSINKRDKYGFTPLLLSELYRQLNNYRGLDRISSILNAIDINNKNKLFPQIDIDQQDDYFLVSKVLTVHNADLDVQDNELGWTALHWAVFSGNYLSVQLLISGGAKVNILSKAGETPLSIARRKGRRHIYDFLKLKNGVW